MISIQIFPGMHGSVVGFGLMLFCGGLRFRSTLLKTSVLNCCWSWWLPFNLSQWLSLGFLGKDGAQNLLQQVQIFNLLQQYMRVPFLFSDCATDFCEKDCSSVFEIIIG